MYNVISFFRKNFLQTLDLFIAIFRLTILKDYTSITLIP
jgi:hypothetical protein